MNRLESESELAKIALDENILEKEISAIKCNEGTIADYYLLKFLFWIMLWVTILVAFLWTIDPYGVSPLQISLPGINTFKPKRINIDRLIKPYEVWRYQPKTIFLGTSRIQQSIDPSVLDGTEFAPAYNAAVPAATITENAAFLEQYIASDPNLKHVFFELFIYAFLAGASPEIKPKGIFGYTADAISLQFSSSAFTDSLRTIQYNMREHERPSFIHARGYWVKPNSWDIAMNFVPQNLSAYLIGTEKSIGRLHLYEKPFTILKHIQDLCDRKGIELTFIITPNYPWDDYRLISLGYTDFVREFYQRVSKFRNVYSFAQNTGPTIEPVSNEMKYWHEPIHFSLGMGKLIQTSLAIPNDPSTPPNFMLRINPSTVDAALKIRLAGLQAWLKKNANYALIFDQTKHLMLDGPPSGSLDLKRKTLTIGNRIYYIQPGIGAVETAAKKDNILGISGWAIDPHLKNSADSIVATSGKKLIAQMLPDTGRYDIEHGFGIETRPAGFTLKMPIGEGPIRVFAIRGKIAGQLASEVSAIDGNPIAAVPGHLDAHNLIVYNKKYPITQRINAGALESIEPIFPGYKVTGWAADTAAKLPVKLLIATASNIVVAISRPMIDRDDIGLKTGSAGFIIHVPALNKPIRIFAIMNDGAAVELNSQLGLS